MSKSMPQDGQVVVFSLVPTGSCCSPGVAYRVEAPRSRKDRFRFVNEARGSSTYDPAWAVASAEWAVQSRAA